MTTFAALEKRMDALDTLIASDLLFAEQIRAIEERLAEVEGKAETRFKHIERRVHSVERRPREVVEAPLLAGSDILEILIGIRRYINLELAGIPSFDDGVEVNHLREALADLEGVIKAYTLPR